MDELLRLLERRPSSILTGVHRSASDLLRHRIDQVWLVPMQRVLNSRMDDAGRWSTGTRRRSSRRATRP